jgi:tRNA(Ile)-lysidine synthase
MEEMLEGVLTTMSRYNMLAPGARVVAAVSGGADSVCLLHVLAALGPGTGFQLAGVAHFNHQLRGAESDEDECFVAQLAQKLGVPLYRASAGAPALAGNLEPGNLEQTLRRARREFFAALLGARKADCIALGHTRDDQAETVLFRLLRGSGLAGMAGILPVTAEGFVRPLLGSTRAEVERFLRDRGIPWREDASNRDPRFARNRIRHRLLPQLEREWNPRLREALAHVADLAYEEERWWAQQTGSAARSYLKPTPHGIEIQVGELAARPRAQARRLVREAIREALNQT